MWFGRKQASTNKKQRTGPPEPGRRAKGLPVIPKAVWLPLGVIIALVLAVLLVLQIGAWLFWENPRFTIRTITIQVDGKVLTPALIRDYTGVKEGQNLFAFNIRKISSNLIRNSPNAKLIAIHRKLPDTLVITVQERQPVVRIGRQSDLAADVEGKTFLFRTGSRDLPVVTGCATDNFKKGVDVDQAVRNAILVIETCHRSKAGGDVHVASIDVSDKEALELYLAGGERIRLAWTDMARNTEAGAREVAKKLAHLADVLRAAEERGRKIANLDLTYGDQYVPAQEY